MLSSRNGDSTAGFPTIGVGKTGRPVSPTSEPDVRISRIRLSGRWCYLWED